MPAVWRTKNVVESANQPVMGIEYPVFENAEDLVVELVFVDSVAVVQSGLTAPANMQGAVHVGPAPVHDPGHFLPVVNVLERKIFHRGARDNETVKLLLFYAVESAVKCVEIFLGRVLGGM